MDKQKTPSPPVLAKGRLVVLISILLLLYVAVPRIGSFSDSFVAVRHARPLYVVGAVVLLVVTYVIAAGTYWLLALKPLRYIQTVQIQAASAFTNRLLPGGLGTLTLYVQYLRRSKHNLSQAIAVVSTNNILGFAGHMVLLASVVLTVSSAYPMHIKLPFLDLGAGHLWLILGIIVAAVAANLLVFQRLRRYAYKLTKEVLGSIAFYWTRPRRFLAAFGLSALLTLCYVAIFYLCAVAIGVHLSVQYIFLVFTIGMVASTATPTPGGLIGAEAGLTGGLIAYGVRADAALAVALLYRFLTYWLPLVPGFIVFVRVRRLYS